MYTRKSPARASLGLITLLLMAGCSTETPGKADPVTPTTSNQSTTPGDPRKAPRVKNPLDATKFIADPCLSLSAAQLQDFKVDSAGRRTDDSNGVGCAWNFGTNGDTSAGVSYSPKITEGLSRLYAQNAANFFEKGYFEPTDKVTGYPAVFTAALDSRNEGSCELAVGLSDQLFVRVDIQGRAGSDACNRVLNVTKAVVETIRGGQ